MTEELALVTHCHSVLSYQQHETITSSNYCRQMPSFSCNEIPQHSLANFWPCAVVFCSDRVEMLLVCFSLGFESMEVCFCFLMMDFIWNHKDILKQNPSFYILFVFFYLTWRTKTGSMHLHQHNICSQSQLFTQSKQNISFILSNIFYYIQVIISYTGENP